MSDDDGFWTAVDTLLDDRPIVVDRPRGTAHPRHPTTVYPLDYGFVDGTRSNDGGGVDVFLGRRDDRALDAVVATADPLKRDVELKLLVGCDPDDISTVLTFLRRAGMSPLLVSRRR